VEGGVVTYIAACVSCCITFFSIRLLGQDALRTLDHRIAVRIMRRLHARPIFNVILLRILFQTMPALNYALAMSGISFRRYLIGTLMGLPLPIVLYCLLFDYLGQMLLSRLH
ncbi:MAG: VTT domain-containing protein, partial [Methylobacterium sp.]|nr:VTT domain-containing protein [Methylobacterium sp.]